MTEWPWHIRSVARVAVCILVCLELSRSFLLKPVRSNRLSSLLARRDFSPPSESGIPAQEESEGVTYEVELPKRSGISWGSDLSFRWVYVLDLEPTGEAAASGLIKKGDYIIGFGNTSLIAQDFDFVLSALKDQPNTFNYTFFRGKKSQLLGTEVVEPTDTMFTVRVIQDGKPELELQCPGGTNLRTLLVGNGINVYRSLTRWTNCNGQQRCGTCIVEMVDGAKNCSRRSLDEEATLRENPENYRLSCITSVYGDVTVRVQGPVGAAQWTR